MKLSPKLEEFRRSREPFASQFGDTFGVFHIPGPLNEVLRVIASCGTQEVPWEHVSVSLPDRCPSWPEMYFVKNLFWDEEEVAVQYHPAASHYVNENEFCLHLWHPKLQSLPMPPDICVAMRQKDFAKWHKEGSSR